jgi:glucose-6-phosphate 1-epimerase
MGTALTIDEMNKKFGLPGLAAVVAGNGGLAKVVITTPAAVAEIYLHGAQVTSYCPAGNEDVLFLSAHSRWEDGKAIRGGIPICFPWFRGKADDSKAPAHGVVRTKSWELVSITESAEGVVVTLATENDEAGKKWWPKDFRVDHRITVGHALELHLAVTNTSDSPMRFEEALHSYHRVGDVHRATVAGLDGVRFLDNMAGNREKVQQDDIWFTRAIDNAYLETRGALELVDPVLGRRIQIEKQDSDTTVVWNPWQDGAAALPDLGDEEWTRFACVEASNILSGAVVLGPDGVHTVSARISVIQEPA